MPNASTLGFEDLHFSYPGTTEELYGGLTHAFDAARVHVITGPSGRGKSTLLYIAGLLLAPSMGTVVLDGSPASVLSDSERSWLRATRFGFVFQDSELDPARTVIDSVMEPGLYAAVPRRTLRERANVLLGQFGLADRCDHRPGQVSGGQAQRVALCRALLNDPAVVLADEPTGNLDRENATVVLEALRNAADLGRTVVVASHDPFVIDQADQVLRL